MPAAKRSRKSTCKGAITLTRQGNKDIVRFKTTANVTPHVFSPNPFDKLPIEIRQMLAGYAETDKDFTSLRRVCRSLHEAIDQDNYSFWRRRFFEVFDAPLTRIDPKDNWKCKAGYQERQRWLCRPPVFERGNSPDEIACLRILRDLILQAYSPDLKTGRPSTVSRNIDHLITFGLKKSSILERIFAPVLFRDQRSRDESIEPLLLTIQVVLTPLILHRDTPEPQVYQFPDSQFAAYASPNAWPLFGRPQSLAVDMEWVLHQVNFWKYHMLRPEECTLHETFSILQGSEKPQFWTESFSIQRNEADKRRRLGKRWLTCFAFVDEDDLRVIRNGENSDECCQDTFEYEGTDRAFPEMELELDQRNPRSWPDKFEECLSSLAPPDDQSTTRSQSRCIAVNDLVDDRPQSFRLRDIGDEATPFYGEGWINALPAQNGIPGFRRFTMMKHQDDTYLVSDKSWAYEGVILPGGKIVLGRWWSPIEMVANPYSGPFIMWCVDKPGASDADEREDRDVSNSENGV